MQWGRFLSSTLVVMLLSACASTKPEQQVAPVDNANASTQPTMVETDDTLQKTVKLDPLNDPNSPLAKRSVYFDFDSSVIKGEYKPTIDAHATFLKSKEGQSHKIVIQGNTDARGSREYNLALGQKRAEAVKSAMGVLGVSDKQTEAISFGSEKPKAQGSTEAAYAENRRADIVYPND